MGPVCFVLMGHSGENNSANQPNALIMSSCSSNLISHASAKQVITTIVPRITGRKIPPILQVYATRLPSKLPKITSKMPSYLSKVRVSVCIHPSHPTTPSSSLPAASSPPCISPAHRPPLLSPVRRLLSPMHLPCPLPALLLSPARHPPLLNRKGFSAPYKGQRYHISESTWSTTGGLQRGVQPCTFIPTECDSVLLVF